MLFNSYKRTEFNQLQFLMSSTFSDNNRRIIFYIKSALINIKILNFSSLEYHSYFYLKKEKRKYLEFQLQYN